MNLIVQKLHKSYGKQLVLNQISITLEGGKCYGLLGKNGAGKTTLLNCLINLVRPDEGIVKYDNLSFSKNKNEIKKKLGIISEDNPLILEFSARQYLRFIGHLYGISQPELDERIVSLFEFFFDNPEDLTKSLEGYSTGMKKKLAICAAVLHKPQVLILDEPFTGLDPIAAQQIIKFLKAYRRQDRVIIISAHELSYIQKVTDHILVLNKQKIVFEGSTQEFASNGYGLIDKALFDILVPQDKNMADIDWIFKE